MLNIDTVNQIFYISTMVRTCLRNKPVIYEFHFRGRLDMNHLISWKPKVCLLFRPPYPPK